MIFNSLTYLILLSSVVPLYWCLPDRPRLTLIFFLSLLFYGFWRYEFIPLLLFSTTIDWWIAKKMTHQSKNKKFLFLCLSLIVNLGLLFYFKYLLFFIDNVSGLASYLGFQLDPIIINIILPLGISFYTFQTISYIVDVYRGNAEPEKNYINYSCYVIFFPQLIAGPVLRSSEVIPQLKKRPKFKSDFIVEGFKRILFGLFLKVVLADNIAPYVDSGFSSDINKMSALDVWTLSFMFGFQIYFDFSAYSHIAIGSAKMIGIRFPENFNFPYLSYSPKEFWQRWHISLSSWIRDYLYFPLMGSKVLNYSEGGILENKNMNQKNKALFISWAIMGLWHGANWTFLVWGFYHAGVIFLYRVFHPLIKISNNSIRNFLGLAITLPIMMLSWIPFRAINLSDTFYMWSKIFDPFAYTWLSFRENIYLINMLILIGIFFVYLTKKNFGFILVSKKIYYIADIVFISILTALVIIFLRPVNQFIYFQF